MFWNRLKRWKTIPTSPGPGGPSPSVTVPRVRLLEEREAAQERRLAGAGRPDDRLHLARLDLERDAVQHLEVAVRLRHARCAQEAHRIERLRSDDADRGRVDVHVNWRSSRDCSAIRIETITR